MTKDVVVAMHKGSVVYWPTGESYPHEKFRVVTVVNGGRDVIIGNAYAERFTVSPLCLEEVE